MEINSALLFIWATLAACFGALCIYRGQLTRYEDEQLFLNEEANINMQEQQTRIVRRVKGMAPVLRACGGAAGLVTVSVVGIYVYNAWKIIQ